MRLVVILLLLLNVVTAGYFILADRSAPNDVDLSAREIHPERIRIVRTDPIAPGSRAAISTDIVESPLSCAAWGSFTESQVTAAEARLAPLELGPRLTRHDTAAVTSYLVIVPPIADRADLSLRLEELTRAGIRDRFVISEGEWRNGISLGFFKAEEAANRHLAMLRAKGVSDAVVKPRASGSRQSTLLLKDLSAAERASLKEIASGFPAVELKIHACPVPGSPAKERASRD